VNEHERRRVEEAYERRVTTPYTYFNPGQLYVVQQQDREILSALRRLGVGANELAEMQIFEVGCGSGHLLRKLVSWGASPQRCAGADIRASAIDRGNAVSPNIRLFHADCVDTGEEPNRYDLVVQNLVFSSVLDGTIREELAREMIRITRPGGIILWCDLRYGNPRNPDVAPIRKPELLELFDGCTLESCRSILLVPPLARRLAPMSTILCDLLAHIPFLRGHLLAAFRKPGGDAA